ncbi:uncharacterized protein N7503_009725 [Penicillium pulvis]|uniref:uncharacterized protein n=1 Tax=Penicillium pulvis TaxID=1562058 RepID=UPI002548B234|nr:uncharacterized protein N7503_009725 [Penicillium pulvis]KAJ5784513.1 hypothetical protein N7503_009725 [Penicillium pulvis]
MVHQQQNAHAGGSLTEMAPTGTSIPNDASKQNIIPSIPRLDQRGKSSYFSFQAPGRPITAKAADNAIDIPRSTCDRGQTGEVMTGTGNTLPAEIESKYMGMNISDRSNEREPQNQDFDGEYEMEEDRKIGIHQFFGIEASY